MKKLIYLFVILFAGLIYPGIASCQNVVNVRGINRTVYSGDTLDLYFDTNNQLTKVHTNNTTVVFDKPLHINTDTVAVLTNIRSMLAGFDLTTKINKSDTNVYVVTYKYLKDHAQEALGFTPENVANKSTDETFADNSDTKYPSQKAVKAYVDLHASSDTITSLTLLDNTTSGYVELITADSVDLNISYMLKRSSDIRVGSMRIYYYGGTLIYNLGDYMENSSIGITFNSVSYDGTGHKIRLYYTSSSTGNNAIFNFKNTRGIISNYTASSSITAGDGLTLGSGIMSLGGSSTGNILITGSTSKTFSIGGINDPYRWRSINFRAGSTTDTSSINMTDNGSLYLNSYAHGAIIPTKMMRYSGDFSSSMSNDNDIISLKKATQLADAKVSQTNGNCTTVSGGVLSFGGTQTSDVELNSDNAKTFAIGGTSTVNQPGVIQLRTYNSSKNTKLNMSSVLGLEATGHGDISLNVIGRYSSDYKTSMTNDNDIISLGKVKQMLTDSGYLTNTSGLTLTNGIHKASGSTFGYYAGKTDAGGASSSGKWWNGSDYPTSTTQYTFDGGINVWEITAHSNVVGITANTIQANEQLYAVNTSSSASAVYGRSYTGSAGDFRQNATVVPNSSTLIVKRTVSVGSSNLTNNLFEIVDDPTTSGTIAGKALTYTAGTTERISLNPRVTSGSSNTAYMFDTHNSLLAGYRARFYNQGANPINFLYDGSIDLPLGATFKINGTTVVSAGPSQNQTFSGQVNLSNPYYTSYSNYTVTTALAVTASSTKVNGSTAVIVFIGDGNSGHVPTFSGFYKVGSTSYSYSSGARNVITFVCIGSDVYYSINQGVLQ